MIAINESLSYESLRKIEEEPILLLISRRRTRKTRRTSLVARRRNRQTRFDGACQGEEKIDLVVHDFSGGLLVQRCDVAEQRVQTEREPLGYGYSWSAKECKFKRLAYQVSVGD